MCLIEVGKAIPTIGRDILWFYLRPRSFVLRWKDCKDVPATKAVLGWALAYAALVIGLFAAVDGKSLTKTVLSMGLTPVPTAQTSETPNATPKFGTLGWRLGIGVGVAFPESQSKGLEAPQIAVFRMGAGWMSVNNVVPSKVGTNVCELLLLNLFIYFIAVCLWPGFYVFKKRLPFMQVVKLANLFVSSIWVCATSLIIVSVVVLIQLFKLSGLSFLFGYICITLLPLLVLSIRAFWVGFRSLSGLNRCKFLGALLISWLVSWIAFPIVSPLIFGVLRFQSFLEAVL
jgi:hypothetical protein